MNNIEKAKAYLDLIPDDIRKEPNQMIEAIENLLKEIAKRDAVIEAAKAYMSPHESGANLQLEHNLVTALIKYDEE
jgi:hypothetical protein